MGKELVDRINTRALVLCSTNSSSSANSTIIFLQEHTPTYSFAQVVYQGLIIPLGSWVGHDTQAWPVRAPHTSGHREHSRHGHQMEPMMLVLAPLLEHIAKEVLFLLGKPKLEEQ